MDTDNRTLKPGNTLHSGDTTYTIVKTLNVGCFGIVYLANCSYKFDNIICKVPVAIKEHFLRDLCDRDDSGNVICPNSYRSTFEYYRSDFVKRAAIFQKFCADSKYIMKINECFHENGTSYCVMEYISGGTLKASTKIQAIDYMLKLCDAVKVLHDNKFLHLDIKLSNVMIKTDIDGNTYPVLIDFGIIKDYDGDTDPDAPFFVTSKYSPPEQYIGEGNLTPATDIYALGATLFNILTNTNPPSFFDSDTLPKALNEADCQEFIPLISKSMELNYKKRFQTVSEFKDALKRIVLSGKKKRPLGPPDNPPSTTRPHFNYDSPDDTTENSPKTIPIFNKFYHFNGRLDHLNNTKIEDTLLSLSVAQHVITKKFGLIDRHNKIILPFDYLYIGLFIEIPRGIGKDFSFGWRLVAPARKWQDDDFNNQAIEILPDGRIVDCYIDKSIQPYFHDEPITRIVVNSLVLHLNDKTIHIDILKDHSEKLGITDMHNNLIAPYIYDTIKPFSEYCSIPGPGISPCFWGAEYTIGNNIGCFKITEEGILIDYQRYERDEWEEKSTWT